MCAIVRGVRTLEPIPNSRVFYFCVISCTYFVVSLIVIIIILLYFVSCCAYHKRIIF